MSNVTLKLTPVRNRAPLTAWSSSLRCVSAAEHHTAEQYSKMGRAKHRKHLSRSDLLWDTRNDFLKTPSLWEAALQTNWRCFSKNSLESNVTPNITRSSDSFSAVPVIVNGGDWGCIVCDLETIRVLALLAFNFIPQRSHHSLTLPRSRIRDSATVTLMTEACPTGVYFNFAMHTCKPYRKNGSHISHVWWLTNDQLISFASRNGKI